MPGIVGLITRIPRKCAEEKLAAMVGALRHEFSYITGTWSDEQSGVYCGWVARAGSFSANMPLCDPSGEAVLIFSGEDYSRCASSAPMAVRSDGQDGPGYLLQRRHDDPAFPASLNGRFQGLLVDRPRGGALLFNDRYGMHRVYYHESADAFYFAAEAKAILAVCPELRRVDPRALLGAIGMRRSCESAMVQRGSTCPSTVERSGWAMHAMGLFQSSTSRPRT